MTIPAPEPPLVVTLSQLVVGELPGAPPSFQERPELTELIGVFDAGGQVAVVCALTGARGVGKTQLAAAYARRQAMAGCALVAWVSAETTDTLIAGLDEVARAVGVADPEGDSAASAVRLRAYLQTRQELALLVIDNVADADQVRRFIPVTGACQVIVTSTDQAVAQLGNLVDVSMFGRGQSLAYLQSRTSLNDDEGADRVAEELGDLPLALAQAASVIQLQQISYISYLSRLRSLPVTEALPRQRGDPYPKGTAEAILLSVQAAENNDKSGLTERLLALIAVLSPNGAHRSLIRQIFEGPENDTTNPAAAALDETLARLVGLSLLVWGESGTSVMVHRLVARVIRDRLHIAGSLVTVLIATVQALTPLRIAEDQAWARRAQGSQLVAHALTIWTIACHDSSDDAPLLPEQLAYCAEMANWAVDHLTLTADVSRAAQIGAQVLAECEQVLGAEHPSTLTAGHNLATAYAAAGRLAEAITRYQQTLRGRERELGAEHPDTLTTRSNLAYWRGEAGDPAGAASAFADLLTEQLRVLGPDHPDTLTTRSSLARWQGEAGDPTAAATAFAHLLTDRLRVLGPDHPDTLTTRSNLARWQGEAGDPTAAVTALEQLLTDRLRVLGPDHPNTLTTRYSLARWKGEAGDPTAAVTALEQLLPDRLRVLGPDHPQTLATRFHLARWQGEAGDPTAAVTALEQLLPDQLRVLGPHHPSTLTTRANLDSWRDRAHNQIGPG
ncbi:MAG: tetratricopeptide repeat protein [Pseudonocardiaceae bacterium]